MKVAFIFPGQGAQVVGMGSEFYDTVEISKKYIDKANEILDYDLLDTLFNPNELINETEYTQSALLATSLAIYYAMEERGLKCDVCAGLSLGEYGALVVSKAITFEDAIKLVRKRGIYMASEVPSGKGAMSAVIGLESEKIEEVISEIDGVTIANYNCPGQIVISGEKEAVEKANEALAQAGARRTVMLNVSGPFHSKMLTGAGEKLYEELKSVEINEPVIPYVTNVDASYVTKKEGIKELLKDQVSSSVMWIQSVENMIDNGVDTFVEIGPNKTLTSFVKKVAKAKDAEVRVYNIEKPEDMEKYIVEVSNNA